MTDLPVRAITTMMRTVTRAVIPQAATTTHPLVGTPLPSSLIPATLPDTHHHTGVQTDILDLLQVHFLVCLLTGGRHQILRVGSITTMRSLGRLNGMHPKWSLLRRRLLHHHQPRLSTHTIRKLDIFLLRRQCRCQCTRLLHPQAPGLPLSRPHSLSPLLSHSLQPAGVPPRRACQRRTSRLL